MSSDLRPNVETLLRQAHSGDQGALGRLLDLYRSYLTLLARLQIDRRLQGKVDASDLVQETFLAAHEGFGKFRGQSESELLGWLRRILADRTAKLVRRFYGTQRRNVRLERQLGDELDRSSCAVGALPVSESSPSQSAGRRERAVLLADALGQLSADYRDVIILRQLEELSFAEVGRRIGRSAESARKLWVRGLAAMRSLLEGELNDSP